MADRLAAEGFSVGRTQVGKDYAGLEIKTARLKALQKNAAASSMKQIALPLGD